MTADNLARLKAEVERRKADVDAQVFAVGEPLAADAFASFLSAIVDAQSEYIAALEAALGRFEAPDL